MWHKTMTVLLQKVGEIDPRGRFMCKDPEAIKKTDNLTVFLALLVTSYVKAASRILVKLTPDLQKMLLGLKNVKCHIAMIPCRSDTLYKYSETRL